MLELRWLSQFCWGFVNPFLFSPDLLENMLMLIIANEAELVKKIRR